MCAKNVINEPFVMINADDFYGRDAYKTASEFIDNNNDSFAIVGFNVLNTLTENGSVKRGVCTIKDNKLVELIESKIEKINGQIICEPLNNDNKFIVEDNTKVSMNMICFTPKIFNYIEKKFKYFLKKSDLLTSEFLIPDVLSMGIKENFCEVKVLNTTSVWVGVTYKKDKEMVVNYINKLINEGIYPNKLWD